MSNEKLVLEYLPFIFSGNILVLPINRLLYHPASHISLHRVIGILAHINTMIYASL